MLSWSEFRNVHACPMAHTEWITTKADSDTFQLSFKLLILSSSIAVNVPRINHSDEHTSVYLNVLVTCGKGMENFNPA
jgi:hypothetical protein